MTDHVVKISDGFHNVRGSFKVGPFDVGTQMSLVKRGAGDFVLLDSYGITGDVLDQVRGLTEGGKAISAILNLHPFHTLHVRAVAGLFPHARLYGTRRHVARASDLRWESVHTEDPQLEELFHDDFNFSVPAGVDFIPEDEMSHFASVLALHKPSGTLHVDDTFTWSSLPIMKGLRLHPTLGRVLQKRPGAADAFSNWTATMKSWAPDIKRICSAHLRTLPPADTAFAKEIDSAFARVEKKIQRHKARFG